MFVISLSTLTLVISTPEFANASLKSDTVNINYNASFENNISNIIFNYTQLGTHAQTDNATVNSAQLGQYDRPLRYFLSGITLIIAVPFLIILIGIYAIYSVKPKRHSFVVLVSIIIIIEAILIYIISLYFEEIPVIESLNIFGWVILSIFFMYYTNALYGYVIGITIRRFFLLKDHFWGFFSQTRPPISKAYLFSWDEVQGDDSEQLKKFLETNYDVPWVRNAKIEKIDNKTINISDGTNYLSLWFNNENMTLTLTINGIRTDEFDVMLENDKLNIYLKLKRIPTGLKFLDDLLKEAASETDKGVVPGSVVLFEGETDSSIGHMMVHLLYLGLQQSHYSIYIAANRPPEIVFRSFDKKIVEFDRDIKDFICCIVSLHRRGLIKNEMLSDTIRDFIYELEKFTYKDLRKEKLKERIEEGINTGMGENSIIDLIKIGLFDEECRPKQKDRILPKFKDFLNPRNNGLPGLLFVVDYNASLIGEESYIGTEPYIHRDQYFKITNTLDIENLHDCSKTIRMIITMKDPHNSKPIRQVYDNSSTIFYLTAKDKDMMHKTMNMFTHQASSARKYGLIIFHSFKKGVHEEKYFKHLEHIADGVISLSVDKELADVPFKFIEVVKMENIVTSTYKTPYRLKDGLIEKMWW